MKKRPMDGAEGGGVGPGWRSVVVLMRVAGGESKIRGGDEREGRRREWKSRSRRES